MPRHKDIALPADAEGEHDGNDDTRVKQRHGRRQIGERSAHGAGRQWTGRQWTDRGQATRQAS